MFILRSWDYTGLSWGNVTLFAHPTRDDFDLQSSWIICRNYPNNGFMNLFCFYYIIRQHLPQLVQGTWNENVGLVYKTWSKTALVLHKTVLRIKLFLHILVSQQVDNTLDNLLAQYDKLSVIYFTSSTKACSCWRFKLIQYLLHCLSYSLTSIGLDFIVILRYFDEVCMGTVVRWIGIDLLVQTEKPKMPA